MDPMDNELKIKLAEGPLGREGFTDGLRQRIEARIEEEGSRPKPRKTGFVAACALLAVTVMLLFVDGERLSSLLRINQSTYDEHSQHAAAPVKESWEASIRSALLLGLRTDLPAAGSQGEYSTYRTVLIAPEHNRLQKTAEGAGILMPYKMDFWKIGGQRIANEEKEAWTITASKAAANPAFEDEQVSALVSAKPVKLSEKLLFAGNRYITVAQTVQSRDPASGKAVQYEYVWVKELLQIAPTRKEISLTPLEEPHVSLRGLLAAYAEPIIQELKPRLPVQPGESGRAAGAVDLSGESWTIVRKQGRWIAQLADYGSAENLDGKIGYRLKDVPMELPASVVSHDELAVSWSEIKRLQPSAVDVFTSPKHDFVAVVTDRNIIIYPYIDQLIPSQLMTIPLQPNESVVMAQWATDRYVESWKQQVKAFLEP
ncbi:MULTISPECIES: hypothetical protein [Paenibacillus]|uniref:Uncharacterized protein n=1 Tax=Paenibacillus naphthalenovorans TaxID=162209 RepID=A0A0U2UH02_9BACL|nr:MULTISPECIES: hypothetical protein [Paenibacillus]ALS25336.1 hypothetical protein IJ22_50770 [Paenibacillus naphthalenovorans]NTZ20241.1 hypothetical protein [Paenibacillus sp. JMULE4]SDJ63676.1 hypothetical protein SAMN05421868_13519 [Paenibacillus naphthalenovorans]